MASINILVVEDDASMRRLICYSLAKHFEVRSAANGQEAFDLLQDRVPDLIVSDLMMPVMDGLQLLRAVRSHPRYSAVPFIVLTAKAQEEMRRQCAAAGANEHLVKHVPMDVLSNRVKHLVGTWPAEAAA